MSRFAALCTALLCAASLAGAELPAPPDPLGLGERLALIDHLREAYGIAAEPGLPLEDLRARYAAAWAARHPAVEPAERDQAQRLRRRIADRFGQEPPADLDLAGLLVLHARLAAAEEERDAQAIQRLLEEPAAPRPVAPVAKPAPAVDAPATAAAKPAAAAVRAAPPAAPTKVTAKGAGEVTITPLEFAVDGVAGAALIAGPKTALCVQFGHARGMEFQGVFETLYVELAKGRGPHDAVFLLGHGSGVSINGAPIGPHLKQYKEFYETFGGTRAAKRLDCIVIASCSKGSPVQMAAMRDGFGYYPTWRVSTAENAYASALSVIAAFHGIADRDAGTPFRGIYRYGKEPEVVGSLGEVGVDGAKGGMVYFDIGVDAKGITAAQR